ncbi:hypothetical protein EVAR_96425_1 [Eumeta japonica]|uniref:Uncharacterized protein n=1 Tax=Eumeta variegata TaxID=151549 RepID=A0A4C1WAH0_EUMVA|nr:hypothetical protein EVAR_96425_1 [Eumeta japonica]
MGSLRSIFLGQVQYNTRNFAAVKFVTKASHWRKNGNAARKKEGSGSVITAQYIVRNQFRTCDERGEMCESAIKREPPEADEPRAMQKVPSLSDLSDPEASLGESNFVIFYRTSSNIQEDVHEFFGLRKEICCARGRPIIVEWERDARHSAGLSLVRILGPPPSRSADGRSPNRIIGGILVRARAAFSARLGFFTMPAHAPLHTARVHMPTRPRTRRRTG